MSVMKSLNKRKDLNSASLGFKKLRENMSTGGAMSFVGGKSEFDEPPFLFLPDQESLSHFMTKQRKMVSSVSSKYLSYNPHGKHDGDGTSTVNGDTHSANKIGNFNEYQHVYNDHGSNEANV
jgi:hypothetical protein